MDDILILYYDTNDSRECVYNNVQLLRKEFSDKTILALPKNYDILLDASFDQLISIKQILDTAIEIKAKELEMLESDLPKM